MLKYIELKTRQNHRGPAWIARVVLSKSGRTVYFDGKALKRAARGGVSGNHYDLETDEEYWVSGVKKDGSDRHWAGCGKVLIEAGAVAEYLELTGATTIDHSRLEVIPDLQPPEPSRFVSLENPAVRESGSRRTSLRRTRSGRADDCDDF